MYKYISKILNITVGGKNLLIKKSQKSKKRNSKKELQLKKELLTEEHIQFQNSVREFLKSEVEPYHSEWEKKGLVSRDIWKKAGEKGFSAWCS